MIVAVLSLEEPDDRVVARLETAGADLGRVHVIGNVDDCDDDGRRFQRRWQLPKDIGILGRSIDELGIELLVLDGIGFSISGDSHNYAIVGSALAALAAEAHRTGVAIVGLVHPPKGGSDPVTAAIGSTAWTAIPRVNMVLGYDPDDESRRVVRVAKTNYRAPISGYSFTIADDPQFECGCVTGIRVSHVQAEDLTAGSVTGDEKSERQEARDFLRAALADGPADAEQVTRASRASERTLRRARKDLEVVAEARRDAKGRVVGWSWALPDGQTANPGGPSKSWPSGPPGYDQENYPSSLPDGQPRESGHLEGLFREGTV